MPPPCKPFQRHLTTSRIPECTIVAKVQRFLPGGHYSIVLYILGPFRDKKSHWLLFTLYVQHKQVSQDAI